MSATTSELEEYPTCQCYISDSRRSSRFTYLALMRCSWPDSCSAWSSSLHAVWHF